MFEIKLYRFDKKINSLKRPSVSDGIAFQCEMKSPSSILRPVIDIRGNTENIPSYNYAFIEKFNRYYFIDDVVWDMGIWTLSLVTDVLASFKLDIENSRQFVTRSASLYNPYMIDNIYPTIRDGYDIYSRSNYVNVVERKNNRNNNWQEVSDYFENDFKDGAFLIGVLSDTDTGTTFYMMPQNLFIEIINKTFTISPASMTDLATGTAQALYNAIQYITVCRWFPVLPSPDNVKIRITNTINIGNQTITLDDQIPQNLYILDSTVIEEFRFRIEPPRHPQISDTGLKYLYYAPYSELNLYFNPFGCIPLDTTKMTLNSYADVHWFVDYANGVASLEVFDGYTGGLIYTDNAEYGVALPISSMVYDWKAGLLMAGANLTKRSNNFLNVLKEFNPANLLDFLPKFRGRASATESLLGGAIDVAASVGNYSPLYNKQAVDIIGSSLGQLNSKGTQGSFLSYAKEKPYIFGWFSLISDVDIARFGSPLYQNVRIDSLQGYAQVSSPTIEFTQNIPTAYEQGEIYEMMSNGFYVE